MKLKRLYKTTAFRLSALYLSLFLVSFAALGVAVYFLTSHMLEQQLRDTIQTNLVQLQNDYNTKGLKNLVGEINEKENINDWDAPDFAFFDESGHRLAGSLPNHRYQDGWQIFSGGPERDDPDEPAVIYADAAVLPGGYRLAVGADGEFIDDFGETIIEAFAWGALLVMVIGVPGSFYLSRSFIAKIGSLTQSTQSIIDGDLTHRLAVSSRNDELDGLAKLINNMLDQINALIENIQQISSDIAHDLRTPISRLRQRLEDAQAESVVQGANHGLLELAKQEVDTILGTFSALLRIANIESGSRRSEFKNIDLAEIARRVGDALLPVTEEAGKTLTLDIEHDTVIFGDADLLTQLIFNLVENAIQYTGEGGQIWVAVKKDRQQVILQIADDGPGIDTQEHEKVFKRFYRIERSRNTPGNGLGLSIAQAVAELHGAKIVLQNNRPGLRAEVAFHA